MPGIGVRVDAKYTGTGMHNVIRSISLAIELCKKYYDVYFFTKFDASYEKIKTEGFNVFKIADTSNFYEDSSKKEIDIVGENPAELKALFTKHNVADLVVDLPFVAEEYFTRIRPLVRRIIHIEDTHRFRSSANILINGSLYAKDIQYPNISGQKLLIGPEYCLLDHRLSQLPERKTTKFIKEIFVHVGAHDKLNLTPNILKTLLSDETIKNFKINTVVDSNFPNLDEISQLASANPNIIIHNNPDKHLDAMLDSHIGITNDVFSIYRLLACGVPTLSFITTDPNAVLTDPTNDIIENIWSHKCIGLITEENNLYKSIISKIHKLLESHSIRVTLSERGKKTIDGMGSFRVAEILNNLLR